MSGSTSSEDNFDINGDIETTISYIERSVEGDYTAKVLESRIKRPSISVNQYSRANGLPEDLLLRLWRVITSGRLFSIRQCTLIQGLIPVAKIPSDILISALSHIGSQESASKTNKELFKWLAASSLYGAANDSAPLQLYYDYVFAFLSDAVLAPYAAHLLYSMTKKHHVVGYRIAELKKLCEQNPTQSHLIALYKTYYLLKPRQATLTQSMKGIHHYKNLKGWKQIFKDVVKRNGPVVYDLSIGKHPDFPPHIRMKSLSNMKVLTSYQFPMELISRSDYCRTLLTAFPKLSVETRYIHWSQAYARKLLYANTRLQIVQKESLENIVNFARDMLDQGYKLDSVLIEYVHLWDGYQHRQLIMTMISTLGISNNVADILQMLEDLYQIFISCDVKYQCGYIDALTDLMNNWTYQASTLLPDEFYNLMSTLLQHIVELICISVMLNPSDYILPLYSGFKFYNTMLDLIENGSLTICYPPGRAFFIRALHSFAPIIVSQLGLLFVRYQSSIQKLKQAHHPIELDTINIINVYLIVTSNTLWRGRALNKVELSQNVARMAIQPGQAFSHIKHPALVFLRFEFEHNNQVTKEDLISDSKLRSKYLDLIHDNSTTTGIVQFLRTFIKELQENVP